MWNSRIHLRKRQHVSFLLALATVTTLQPTATVAEVSVAEDRPDPVRKICHFYGCPLLPRDVHYDQVVREALETLRNKKGKEIIVDADSSGEPSEVKTALSMLESSGNADSATLTLIGYKGGALSSQVNQDRAFVVSPYLLKPSTEGEFEEETIKAEVTKERKLLGVFDGHARLGEHVSEYTVQNLPKLLSEKLDSALASVHSEEEEEIVTKLALEETFVQMDKDVPGEVSGGCTASVILQLGSKLFIANAGDSRSFIVIYYPSQQAAEIVYISREDKPHLPDERARVEKAGGDVYVPARIGATSRVIYIDPHTGSQNGLAMSRSIGDWAAGKRGVIPNPIVDVIDIPKMISEKVASVSFSCIPNDFDDMVMDACRPEDEFNIAVGEEDIRVFAVSATDGLMDYVTPEMVAETIAASLYAENGSHPLSGCENLVSMAAAGWYHAKQGRYRDDIAIAVSKIV